MGITATKSQGGGNFQPCPEYQGRAVCVDITPLKAYETQFGTKEKFKIAFEIDLIDDSRKPPQPWVVMTAPMTPSLHEKAALTRFLRDWFGRALTPQETSSLDLDTLIGRPASVVIVHESSPDGSKTFANIKLIMAHKAGEALKPSGLWVRLQDRPPKDGAPGQAGEAGGDSTYRRTSGTQEVDADTDISKTKVHVGKHKGVELRELTEEAITALIEHWLPKAKAAEKQTADDKRLIRGLDWYQDRFKQAELAQQDLEQDDIPY